MTLYGDTVISLIKQRFNQCALMKACVVLRPPHYGDSVAPGPCVGVDRRCRDVITWLVFLE